MSNDLLCSVDGCAKKAHCRGFCTKHYRRWRKYGDPLISWPNKTGPCSVEGCNEKRSGKGFCTVHYARFRRHGDPLKVVKTPYGEPLAFLEEALRSDTDECILWPYAIASHGYGMLQVNGELKLAHRVALERSVGPPPTPRHQATHAPSICHEPACINPRHLRWATAAENAFDRRVDGTHREGDQVPWVKLSPTDILAIRNDMRSQSAIATDYGISQGHVSEIKNRHVWRHIS